MLESMRNVAGAKIVAAPVYVSEPMQEVLAAAEDVACANTTVLLLGESGTGKEVLARFIHQRSPRAEGPWVAVNCAALPADLLESELFGHERGAFTGANERRLGKIEQAHGGTVLLDEISELPLPLQAKLLRVLQEREVDRVGGTRPVPVDVRFIATSNRSLEEMVTHKQFRADLYYRLCVFPIVLPPLRDRPDDIPVLAAHFLDQLARDLGRPGPPLLTDAAASALASHGFPGNVRELRNVLERALVRCREPQLDACHLIGLAGQPRLVVQALAALGPPGDRVLPAAATDESGWSLPIDLEQLERLAIGEALRRVEGNRTHAARLLGISLRTLRNKLRLWRTQAAALAGGQDLPPGDHEGGDDASDEAEMTLAQNSQRTDRERAA